MIDPRAKEAARILVEHSTRVKAGDRVLIDFDLAAKDMALEAYRLCIVKGAYPMLRPTVPGASFIFYKNASEKQLKHFPIIAEFEAKNSDVLIPIGAEYNTRELTSINPELIAMRKKVTRPISEYIVDSLRWVIYEYPTSSLAQEADMSLEEMEDFVFSATNIDWKKESSRMKKLKELLDRAKLVRIRAPDTDLALEVAGRNTVIADGRHNMPDGEVFTAPVETNVNGHIQFTYPAIYGGRGVDGIRLEFRKGKVTKAAATKNEEFLKKMLAMDKGAGYIGELGIGTNFNIKRFIKNILFDEKIGGTIHIALGNAYKECKGTNKSALHWDMIKDLRKGGEVWFDDTLVQKGGKFLV